jgi:hypothetical protein
MSTGPLSRAAAIDSCSSRSQGMTGVAEPSRVRTAMVDSMGPTMVSAPSRPVGRWLAVDPASTSPLPV